MELRRHLAVIRRGRWLVIEALIVVVVAAVLYTSTKAPIYKASARVLLSQNDPSAALIAGSSGSPLDAQRNGAVQAQLVKSPAVAIAVAQRLHLNSSDGLANRISVSGTDILEITATDPDPAMARDLANGFATTYLEDRRQKSVATLQQAADELTKRLNELKVQLDAPLPPGASADVSGARAARVAQYQSLYDKQQQLLVSISLVRGAELISEAKTPVAPAGLSNKVVGALAAIVGLALGIAAAFLRDQFDDRLHSRADVEAANGLSVLAEFPFDRRASRAGGQLMAVEQPRGAPAEAARALRMSLSFLAAGTPLRRILITSAEKGEGKTLIAANLAATFAQGGSRTILVSADLRTPRLDAIFGLTPRANYGFTNLIKEESLSLSSSPPGEQWMEKALVVTKLDNLLLLPAGDLAPNPADLLASSFAKAVFETAAALSDVVIIDSAPVLAVSDTVALADKVDGVVLVDYLGRSHRELVQRSIAVLQGTRVSLLGVVINGAKRSRGAASSYYAPSDKRRRLRIRRRRQARSRVRAPAAFLPPPLPAPLVEDNPWPANVDLAAAGELQPVSSLWNAAGKRLADPPKLELGPEPAKSASPESASQLTLSSSPEVVAETPPLVLTFAGTSPRGESLKTGAELETYTSAAMTAERTIPSNGTAPNESSAAAGLQAALPYHDAWRSVAVVHDYLTQHGGAERVVLSMLRSLPGAGLYTALYEPASTYAEFSEIDVRTLPIDHVGTLRRHHRLAFPLLAPSFSRLRLSEDVVMCSSSGWAHGAHATGRKIVYCHSPAKWLHQPRRYFANSRGAGRAVAAAMRPLLMGWDLRSAASADRYLANSTMTARLLRELYGLEAEVLFAPHCIDATGPQCPVEDLQPGFFLCVSRLMPYKHVDEVIAAFRQLPSDQLVIVGTGPCEAELREQSGSNVVFQGTVDDATLRWLYSNSRALVSASQEDFGLTSLEAAAFGRPAAVLRWGGFLDNVVEGRTGLFFDNPERDEIRDCIRRLLKQSWDTEFILRHAERFSEARFSARLRDVVTEELLRA